MGINVFVWITLVPVPVLVQPRVVASLMDRMRLPERAASVPWIESVLFKKRGQGSLGLLASHITGVLYANVIIHMKIP